MEIVHIFLIIFSVVLGIILFISFNFARFLVLPIRVRPGWVIKAEERKGLISIKWYNELVKEEICIRSEFGYKLFGELVINDTPSDKFVVIVHGYRFNYIGSLKYGKMFLDLGYNVLWYDNCNCGKSKGKIVTMGKRESKDLAKIIEYLRSRFNNSKIGIHGESMGATLSMMYGATDSNLSFIIEDCGYSDLKQELTHQLKKLKIPVIIILPIARLFIYLICRLKLNEVSPITLLKQDNALAKIPMLFIHGAEDNFTPTSMCYDLFDAKRGEKYICICDKANHAESFLLDRLKYINTVKAFLYNTNFKEETNE
ncbi:MAG: alpha/beta hydrolase [Clostridia bacterium]|nr:alpha/beta hydrolase [Clostridia bacterium]